MKTEIREHPAYGRVLHMQSETAEIAVALDYGIRIVHLSCLGMENLMYVQPQDLSDGLTTEKGWRIYGGHRLWMAPECDLTYCPDNDPVTCERLSDGARFTQKVDPWVGLQKRVTIRFAEDGKISVLHEITNCSGHDVTLAPWGVSTLRGGGSAALSFPKSKAGECNPARTIAYWGDTSAADPRLTFTPSAILARHDSAVSDYLKIGVYSATGVAEVQNLGQAFTVSFRPHTRAEYTDCGSNLELFLNPDVMEIETLGTLQTLASGESACHTEYWALRRK